MEKTIIGIIGCGVISDAYLKGADRSDLITVKAVADLNADVAAARARAYGVEAKPVDRLLADSEIEIVLNLTVPLAHAEVGKAIITAGKHVYSEKPLAAALEDGRALMAVAEAAGVRVGCAPDTFLGAGHQACRHVIDDGRIGEVVGGAAAFLTHGMEDWHPNPTFYYSPGGSPVLDMGPYYITQLINLIGPVRRVTAEASMPFKRRLVSAEGPMKGKEIEVKVPTTVNGVLAFENGANVAITTTWDAWNHDRRPIEIYGARGSMQVPDPNFFGGEPMVCIEQEDWAPVDISSFAFGTPNRETRKGTMVADHRIIGLLDMAAAIKSGRPHRASGELALHVLEVMDALLRSSEEGHHVTIESRAERPAAMPEGEDERVFV
jgi:predicted dehydrogenase